MERAFRLYDRVFQPLSRRSFIPTGRRHSYRSGSGSARENLDSDRNYGFDLELTHRNRIKDFRYNVKGLLSMTRVKRLHVERAPSGSSWENWKQNENDRLQGVQRGLQGDGQFQSWEDIYRNPYYTGRGA